MSPLAARRRFDAQLMRAVRTLQPSEAVLAARTIGGCLLGALCGGTARGSAHSADVELDFALLRAVLASASGEKGAGGAGVALDAATREDVFRAVLSPALLSAALFGAEVRDGADACSAPFALFATNIATWVAEAPAVLLGVVAPFVVSLVERTTACLEEGLASKKCKKSKKSSTTSPLTSASPKRQGALAMRLLLCVLPCVHRMVDAAWLTPLIALTARALAASTHNAQNSVDLRHLLSMLVSASLERTAHSEEAPLDVATFAALVTSRGALGMIGRVLTHANAPDYLATLSRAAVDGLFARA